MYTKDKIQKNKPYIHCITNHVSMESVANIILAVGAKPIMASASQEVEEITAACNGLLLNCGTPDNERFKSFMLAGLTANENNIPVVIDPVGIGASKWRYDSIITLLDKVKPSILRCNLSEANVLLKNNKVFCGVDSDFTYNDDVKKITRDLANTYECTVLLSGKSDFISNGIDVKSIDGDNDFMRNITGTGCMLSGLTTAFSTQYDAYNAVIMASSLWKQCGLYAQSKSEHIGTQRAFLFDAVQDIKQW